MKNALAPISLAILILLYPLILFPKESEYAKVWKGMFSTQPASLWQDALISGNGIMGIMVFGDPENEKVIFNHEFLYEPLGSTDVEPPVIAPFLDETRRLLRDKRYEEAINYSYDKAVEQGYAGLQWTDPYHPALALEIDQPLKKEYTDYKRSINFETGELKVEWISGNMRHTRRSFVSRHDNVIVQLLENEKNKVDCELKMSMQGAKKNEWADRRDFPIGYENQEISYAGEWMTFRLKYVLNNRGYEVVTKIISPDGKIKVSKGGVSIKRAEHIMLISRIVPLSNYSQSSIENAKLAINALNSDYEKLLAPHVGIHGELFNRVDFDIFSNTLPRHSSEQLIANQIANPDEINNELLETVFDMGRYALISSSGNNPPNLMGIWNGQWRPAWSGDFTTDANVNLQISSANICNLPEAIDSYMKMLERVAPDWEINAKNLYGCRGYLAGPRTSGQRGLHTHFNVNFPGHFWLAGAAWLLAPCYEYYQVSGDIKFLRKRLLPMMEKTALFFEDFLSEEDENEKFFFAPSYSPENRPANQTVHASVNATMDIAASKEIITNLIRVYEELDIKSEKKGQLTEMLIKFPSYLVNTDGALKEWTTEDLEDNYNHRHVSHLYPVWPGHEINPEETPELFAAATIAAQKRGSGNESAHGLTHMALIGARLKQPNLVSKNLLFMLSNKFLYRGLFTSHNPNLRIFNSDALCSFPAVIAEALVYSRPGFIELLPAWDSDMAKGKITNIACRTQAVVKALSWNMDEKTIQCTVFSSANQELSFMLRRYDTLWEYDVSSVKRGKGALLRVNFKRGETKTFTVKIID